ncbi:MAG: 4Fe-4S ferredoxin [Bacteroidales bacterium]|nr:4Fe-4S ferredoxin [Bacteroidales bacterium]
MKRTIIKIDEQLCNGCGLCVNGCHEGALQIIDGKARMISDLFCDGLGACIGECPLGAIELEEREAVPYDEIAVMERLVSKGEKTIWAHLLHLKEHNEMEYFNQGVDYLRKHDIKINRIGLTNGNKQDVRQGHTFSCPGKRELFFAPVKHNTISTDDAPSQLRQWPVQLHLLNPGASYFQNADVVLAADCTAFSYGNFHDCFLKNRVLAIACPKLDTGKESYLEKLAAMIDGANINTLTVVIMEVPCCGRLVQIAQQAVANANRKIPVKKIIIGVRGEIISEEWI